MRHTLRLPEREARQVNQFGLFCITHHHLIEIEDAVMNVLNRHLLCSRRRLRLPHGDKDGGLSPEQDCREPGTVQEEMGELFVALNGGADGHSLVAFLASQLV